MANFPRQTAVTLTPTAITDLVVRLHSPDTRGTEPATARYNVGVLYNNGEVRYLEGDWVPYLTNSEINSLLAFMDTLRSRAVAQLLPAP
jgi:hypothetical protein